MYTRHTLYMDETISFGVSFFRVYFKAHAIAHLSLSLLDFSLHPRGYLLYCHTYTVGTSDFDKNFMILMCGIKFWKENKYIWSIHKNLFFEILSGFLNFWPVKFPKSSIVPSRKCKHFLWIGRMGYQKVRLFILISKIYIWP
jgi:hypothetical protein